MAIKKLLQERLEKLRRTEASAKQQADALEQKLNRIDPLVCQFYPDEACPLHNLQCVAPKCLVRRSTLE